MHILIDKFIYNNKYIFNIMLKKLISVLIFFIFILALTQTLTLGSYITGNTLNINNIVKNIACIYFQALLKYGFDSQVYYSGEYNKTDKIDIIMSNHLNALDGTIYISIIRQFDDRDIFFIHKKNIVFTPGVGFIVTDCNDIKLSRKLEDDMDNMITSIDKIKSGIIVIYPEGTRFNSEKHMKSIEFSKNNNLHVFDNILYPKMKGMWIICNELIKHNKMGNIIDISILIEKIQRNDSESSLLKKDLGNSYGIINTYNVPYDGSIVNYDQFKKWFLPIWIKKDNILNTVGTIYDKSIYQKSKLNIKPSEYMLFIFTTSMFIYIMVQTKGLYLPISLLCSYIIIYIKYKSM